VAGHALATVTAVPPRSTARRWNRLECLRLASEVGDRGVVLASLYGLATVAARQDRGRVAGQLWGAAEALCAELGRTLAESGQRMRNEAVAAVRAALVRLTFVHDVLTQYTPASRLVGRGSGHVHHHGMFNRSRDGFVRSMTFL